AGTVTLVSAIGDPAQVVDIGSTGSLDLFSTLVGSVRRYYSTDGTVAGTVLLQTINGGAPLRPGGDLGIIYGHGMYFADNGNGYTVYTTNGTVAGTATLLSAIGNPANVHGLGGMSYTNSSTTALVNVDENEAVAADIDTLTTVAGLTFLIQGGADAARFSINATTGILTFLAAPNYEAPDDANHDNVYDLIVRVTGGGATSDQALTIRVVNVNEAPAITSNGGGGSAALSIAENSVAVVTVTAVDPDAASTFTFQLAGGTDAALFRINAATGTLTFATAPDFERPADADNDNVYEVIVAVSDGLVQDMQSLSVRLNNIVESAAEGNFILGTAGNDVISASVTPSGQPFATTRDDVVFGNGGNDEIYGGPGVDSLNGGSGNDILGGDEDNDLLDGGEGEDRLYGWTGEDVLRGGAGRDQLLGDDGDDTLEGGADDDELGGWLGNDILDGGAGADSLNGWAGNDWYFVDNAGDQVFEAAGQGNDRVFASVSYTLTANAEVELMTTDFNPGTAAINLTGNERAQVIYGNDGANQLTGGGGGDAMVGLGGSDFFFVNDTRDVIYEAAGGGSDRVFAGVSYTLTAGAEVEMLTTDFNPGTAAINLTGNALAQAIFGNAGANQLNGGGGADTLVGFGGDDWYFIVGGNEGVVESAGGGSDRIFAGVDYRLQAGSEVELLTTDFNPGTAAINLTGNELANTIYGNAGDNVLDGKGGNDGLVGLGGADTFQFTTALGAGNVDFVYDFVHGTDKIALDDAVFGAGIGTPGTFNANAFHVGTAAHDLDDRILYNSATGQLYFDADGSGAGAAIQFATLGTGLALSASDFQVI
ncbi:MAG TPA: hypothetical protein VEX35_07050, partial [Allosphingosinicella sp.]|nr:hypothetical protein [Allosphingosinicella sp.]